MLDLPVHPFTGLTAIGLLDDGRPVWPVMGGAPDDDDDLGMDLSGNGKASKAAESDEVEDDLDELDDDTDSKKDDEDDWKPPTREEWKKVQDALTEANDEAKRRRLQVRELRRQERTAERQADRTGDTSDEAAAQAAQNALEAAERKYKPVAVRSAAIAELIKAEFRNPTDTRLSRMIGRLNMDELDVDPESGKVDGLEDQIEDLKDEFPELFGKEAEPEPEQKPEPRRRAARINGANQQNQAPAPKSTGEKHMARLGLR